MPEENVLKLSPRQRDGAQTAPAVRTAAGGEVVLFPGLDVGRIQAAWAFWKRTGRTYKD